MDYLWDLLEDPTCDPPKDCLYYYPGQRLTRGNAHQQEPKLPNGDDIPILMDLPRYGRPLPIALSPRDTEKQRLIETKKALVQDVYADSIGNPADPTVPIIDTILSYAHNPQLDGSSESKHAASDYADDSSRIIRGVLRGTGRRLVGPLMIEIPEYPVSEDDYEEAFREFGVEFLSRMLQNPKYLFEMIKYVDQEEHGTLNTENLVRLIFKVAE